SGEVSECKWLIYSPIAGSIYCFACKLFSNDQKNCFGNAVFQDWKHADRALSIHENSECHRRAMMSLTTRMDTEGCIDKCLVTQYRAEKQYWRDMLHRVLNVVQFLAECRLAFCGENEIFGSPHNGNFLGIVELIAKYDFETHSSQDIAKSLLQFFEKIGVNIADCRGQSYDNASNLSGKYQGMQAWIRERSENAVYIPCCAHSLNLVGQCAVDCCFTAISFFSFVQKLYVFFAASTKQWKVLLERLAKANKKLPVVKNLSETHWSAYADAVTALQKGYDRIALDHLSCDDSQKSDKQGLSKTMEKLEISIMTEIWHTILERFHKTSAKLQDPKMDLNTAVVLLESLHVFINSLRSQFSHFENRKSCVDYYRNELHRRRNHNRQYDDGESEETQLSPHESFRIETYMVIMDKLPSALVQQLDAYKEVCSRFGFLSKLTSIKSSGDGPEIQM
uniref:Uncharacterized protein n=1 Tax=Latimeria chalumnae TaxID=7897 RepID=H3B9S8_LATCH